jgi:hypothetical protein
MFSSTARFVSSLAALSLALSVPANADKGLRLSMVAAQNGFTYEWMPTEAGAMLARPGVRIILRAGRLFYEVNNATPIADIAPRFDGRDLIVSQRLATHLHEIALKYSSSALITATESTTGESDAQDALNNMSAAMTLTARRIPGRDALELRGTGPADVPLTITLRGELSADLPIVVLSRKSIKTATDGTFSAEVEYGQDSHVHTTLAAMATTLSGASSAEARIVIGVPSPQIKSSILDDWPKK